MNVAVVNIKDIIKFIVKLIIIIIIIIFLIDLCKKIKRNHIQSNVEASKLTPFLKFCIDTEIGLNNKNKRDIDLSKRILIAEIGDIKPKSDVVKSKIEEIKKEEAKVENIIEQNQEETIIGTDVTTEPVSENNIIPTYTNTYKTVEINNKTSFLLTEEILTPNIEIDKNNIAIYHTHTCESYTSSDKFPYEMTGNYRTTDLNFTVARVGTELTNYLSNKGFNVLHDSTYHDYPAYSGSYTRSLETIKSVLADTNIDIVLDIHRDAVGNSSEYAPRVKINGETVAQLMFVMGTNEGGLEHSNWQQNLKFAVLIQEVANEMYPGLFRPIMLSQSRYNEHVAKAACIIEVGATGNTLEECILSMQCLSNVFEKSLK